MRRQSSGLRSRRRWCLECPGNNGLSLRRSHQAVPFVMNPQRDNNAWMTAEARRVATRPQNSISSKGQRFRLSWQDLNQASWGCG